MSRVKHNLSDDDDEGVDLHSSAAKRPRVDDSSPLPGSSPPPLPSALTDDEAEAPVARAGKAPAVQNDEESDDGDEEMADDDAEEEERVTQGVSKLKAKPRSKGSIAQSGVIQQVDLTSFMCHSLLTVKFGPQIGNNGSGKSAVLTGISIALGGNAKTTNRAKKGGDLVKHGAPYAICAVKLKNEGTDAFQPKTYGKSITIERRVNKDMGGVYKIRNAAGKTIDTKKATLDAILDHFNIQVENPMTVLTQDQSRQFLANSTPKDKYTFFLRGTQLAQLTEEYEKIRANTEDMEEALSRKKEVIPELKEAYKRAKARAVEAKAAAGQEERVGELKQELAWAYVGEKEDRIKAGMAILNAELARGPKLEEAIVGETTNAEEARTEAASIEAAMREKQDTQREDEIAAIKDDIKVKAAELKERMNQQREFNVQKQNHVSTIEQFKRELASERAKLERGTDSERKVILDEIATITDQQAKISVDIARARNEAKEYEDAYRAASDDLQRHKEDIRTAEAEASKCQGRISHLKQSKSNPMSNFGQGVPQLERLIQQNQRSWIKAPVGPLGAHVELKDPRYSAVLESFFNHTLNAYVVTNEQDMTLLQKLQRQANSRSPIIKQAEDPTFDCSSGEPDSSVLTILRVLNIKNPVVLKALVDSNQIEKSALVEQRALGDNLMRSGPYNVQACYSADSFKLGGGDGGSSTMAMDRWKGNSRLNPDVQSEIESAQAELNIVKSDIQSLQQKRHEIDQNMGKLHTARKTSEDRSRNGGIKVTQITNRLDQLNDKLQEDEPTNIGAIEDAIQEQMTDLASLENQAEPLHAIATALSQQIAPLVQKRERLEVELKDANRLVKKLAGMLEKRMADVRTADDNLRKLEKKMEEHVAKAASLQADVDGFETELEEMIEQAASICDRPVVEKKKSAEKLTQEISTIMKALKEREKRQGASVDQINEELKVRREVAEKAIEICKELQALVSALQSAYDARIARWTDFRDSIATRAKMQFLFHLSNRGFTGRLQFDHDKGKLSLRVQTDDLEAGTAGRQKDAKSLSGGEKSFSTICLLLTMWEAVGCPVRCLDEFDVFMDSVNRHISMKMITDTGKAADATQFILITPQSVNEGSFRWGPEVRVIKMRDPERGQGTLAIGAN